MKTYNNRRGIISTFLKFAFHRSWIAENPILKVPHHRIRRRSGSAATLTAVAGMQGLRRSERPEVATNASVVRSINPK